MMAAMDSAECSLCILSREKVAALVLFVLTIFGRVACGADSGLFCYSCTNVPHPRDCDRIVRCGPNEACSVESFLNPFGSIVYNMGCSSQLKCHNPVVIVGRRESMLPAVKKRVIVTVCFECCTNNSFCNRQLCDTKVNLTGKLCMQCDDVVTPKDCATVALCQAGEICYTESKIIHGENRYRLGCVKEMSCQQPAASETITTINPMLNTCGVCCKREIENCNLELCDQHGGSPLKDTMQMYLVDPPIDINGVYCHDQSETGCILLGAERPNFCDSPSIKNHVCPKFCGTCVPSPTLAPGIFTTDGTGTTHSRVESSTIHTNLHPTDTTAAHPTKSSTIASASVTSSKPPKGDCFYRSSVYLGRVSTAIGNIACDRWDAHLLPNDSLVSMFPDQRLEDALNYCRDPDGKGHPWCYVKENPMKSWEFCDVPYCSECYYTNQSHLYNGYVSLPNIGECLNWTGSFPDSFFIDGSITKAKNYCRDPDKTGYPYCITSSGFVQCKIPLCQGTCEDDPNTRCEDLKLILCQSEHLAKLFCPKSCNMCGFGLTEPVHVPPPVLKVNNTSPVTSTMSTTRTISTLPTTMRQDICEDSVNFTCNNPDIKTLVCMDLAAGTNYCKKTCNFCGIDLVPLNADTCGDPIKESMCALLHVEMCICYDKIISSVLCPHYCADQCGPVNRTVTCPGPIGNIIGRR